jgi:hypothetical protein
MHIADAILHANSAGVVLFLLTSYIEAVRHEDIRKVLPNDCVGGEYRRPEDVARCLEAVLERDLAAESGNTMVAEVTRVFSAARNRLWQLEQSKGPSDA